MPDYQKGRNAEDSACFATVTREIATEPRESVRGAMMPLLARTVAIGAQIS
jgi:hypothetical protein